MQIKMDPVLKHTGKLSRRDVNYLVYLSLFRAISDAVRKHAKGRVLDIGCGNKPYKAFFDSNKEISTYTGCDARQNEAGTVDIICDAGQIPLANQCIDTVFCTQVIEHLPESASLLSEVFRLLAPGGKLILSGPLYWPVHGEPHDYFRFTRYGFEKVLEKAGLKMIEVHENGGIWATAGQALAHAYFHSGSKSWFFRFLRFSFFKLRIVWISNTLFGWLDKKDFNPASTINYVVVAEKPA